MVVKKPSELVPGDVFEEPESEEEFHGQVSKPEARECYLVKEIVERGAHFTSILIIRQSDNRDGKVSIGEWVPLSVEPASGQSS
jgi:hypothetical protein